MLGFWVGHFFKIEVGNDLVGEIFGGGRSALWLV